ncbi:MAG: CRISPR-associated protein Csx10, partial [Actinomycetota bacterium]|nr:CRISPR-associated protein Csx10 [Actinomycetota bacterium]
MNGPSFPLLGETLQLALTMTSDWHVGAGYGRPGEVDRLVRRDPDDLPFVPAKTLTGIWRDACEVVARGLDDGTSDGSWQEWVRWIFGSQPAQGEEGPIRRAALSIRAARYPAALRNAMPIPGRARVREAVTFVKPRVAIDPATGHARPDFLRFEEMARAGSVLTASARLDFEDLDVAARSVVTALLVMGAAMVERLGGKRRRGAGSCRMEIDGAPPLAAVVEWVRGTTIPRAPVPSANAFTIGDQPVQFAGRWMVVPLSLRLESPVIVHLRTIGNSVCSLPFIPGGHLLAAALARLPRAGQVDLGGAARRGELVVTNATVLVEGERAVPVPACLVREKDAEDADPEQTWFNLFAEGPSG